MAKFRPVDLSASPARDRQSVQTSDGAAMTGDRRGADSWAMVHGGDEFGKSSAISSQAIEATVKQDEPEEAVAIPTPIGCWKVISPDGREERVFKPIPGFEHLFNGPAQLQGLPRPAESPRAVATPACQPVVSQVPAPSREGQTKKRKRTRSRARGRLSQIVARQPSDDENDEQLDDRDVSVSTAKSYTFYIGDVKELKRFFRKRLDELTMKPVRPIVTAWVKLLEPKRLTRFGPYHKKLPNEQPQECTPPWWPRDVPYEEPSHLDKDGLLTLAVDLMLQHRNIDVGKRNMDWVTRLRNAAHYAVETTPPDQFSSSKGSAFSERMQGRALGEIIPNLFDIALSYQEHFARYTLYEGTNNRDPGIGTHVTWRPLTRPPRQAPAPRKRVRQTRRRPASRTEYDAHESGHDIGVDNTATESHLRPEGQVQELRQQAQAPSHGDPTPHLQHTHMDSSMPTLNTSFDQSTHACHLGDNMDLDVKLADHVPYQGRFSVRNNFGYDQPMQFPNGLPNYHHTPQPQQGVGRFDIISATTSGYEQPFFVFPAYHPQAEISTFESSAGFPVYHDVFVPPFFDGLPTVNSISCQPEASHH
ncbi:hypothetical protein CUC08_Gglean006858 [Alternaria sp. MG1]|nr:hypothetical protein CUC08_Gglean006858 [Alternaria sp. MG1]